VYELSCLTIVLFCFVFQARRIFKLMNDHQQPVSAYSWSILVDIHAKMGDFEGCGQVIKEMAADGVPPTQAAYTSLLAACYKVCNNGRIPHSIRANAGKFGWRYWQEMRIVGMEPDTMAYGAIIRLCSARGQAERAINLLEEMNRFDVKPTSLCFSSALRAVARSHEIAVRFERGWSRKQMRRELFAAHHGKMARQIVIMAESTEVEQDEGFVSALMLCAAAAGDSATAKAVYLAAEVRNMDHLRMIGSEAQLKQLLGNTTSGSPSARDELAGESHTALGDGVEGKQASNSSALATVQDQGTSLQPRDDDSQARDVTSFGEREYGKDTRSLSALLRAAGQAMDGNGIGTIWAGRQNQGYLCENSLRLITTRWEPSYTKSSVPSENSTKIGISALRRYDEEETDEQRKKGARKKFRGLFLDDDGVETIDEYAEEFDGETIENDAASAFLEGQGHAHNESSQFSEEDFRTVSDSSFQPSMKTTSEFAGEVTHSSEPGTDEQEYSAKAFEVCSVGTGR
jgi:pentatricopeptide repeat protein